MRLVAETSDLELIVCDVAALADPDLGTVDALARLQLTAQRCGRRVRLQHACVELRGLLDLTGLSEVVAGLSLEPRGEPEEREPALRVEEERDPGDPPV